MTMQGLTPARVIHLTPNVWTAPFWAATAEHRLVLPRCTACSAFRFPPTPFCWRCRAQDVDWIEHHGHGTIYSFTVGVGQLDHGRDDRERAGHVGDDRDRKSTRLNSSHRCISYAVF